MRIVKLVSLAISILAAAFWIQFGMAVSSIVYPDEVDFITALFDADIQLDNRKLQGNKAYTLQENDEKQTPQSLAEAKKLLLQSIDFNTKVIKDFEGLVKVIDFAERYVTEYWGLLPEKTKLELIRGSRILLDVVPENSINVRFSKLASFIVHDFFKNPIRNIKKYISIFQQLKDKDNSFLIKLLGEKLNNFANSVQRLEERSRVLAELQGGVTPYPDWDREDEIRKNAIEWIQARRQKDDNMSPEEARRAEEEFQAFKKIIDSFRSVDNKLYSEE